MSFTKHNSKKSVRKKGFTLVEMLIAVVIFSFMVGLAAYSFRFYIGLVNKIVMPYPKDAVIFSKLRSAIDSMFYYVAEKKDIVGKQKFYYYFYGNNKEMRFITTKPILSDELYVCEIHEKNGDLVWEESPVYCKNNDYKNPDLVDPKSIVLFSDISDFEIGYFVNGQKIFGDIKEEMPDLIEVSFVKKKTGKKFNLYFKIKSTFNNKKALTEYIYAPQ